jgi:glutaminyl-tRNA synthetase
MASPNIWMRRSRPLPQSATPSTTIQAINGASNPMYDFAHCLSDYIEGITHSICTLEFEVPTGPLYDWILQSLDLPPPVAETIRVSPS